MTLFLRSCELLELPGFGRRRSPSFAAHRESKGQPFHVVFPSLGIPDIGQKVTEQLLEPDTPISTPSSPCGCGRSRPSARNPRDRGKDRRNAHRGAALPTVRRRITRLRKAGLQFAEPRAAARLPAPAIRRSDLVRHRQLPALHPRRRPWRRWQARGEGKLLDDREDHAPAGR